MFRYFYTIFEGDHFLYLVFLKLLINFDLSINYIPEDCITNTETCRMLLVINICI
jgi:hypothetical protein